MIYFKNNLNKDLFIFPQVSWSPGQTVVCYILDEILQQGPQTK